MSANYSGTAPYTTTPEERIGPGAPYSDASLQANLIARVVLGILSLVFNFVPTKLLWWNGEFAATVFCLINTLINLYYVVNALIWSDDNVETWWAGHGWCDLQAYTTFALRTAWHICLFEMMRSLARKVSLVRVGAKTDAERRRHYIVTSFVVFTLPLLQVALSYFLMLRRYDVSTLAGCNAVYDPNWIFLILFVLPTPLFVIGAAYMAGQ